MGKQIGDPAARRTKIAAARRRIYDEALLPICAGSPKPSRRLAELATAAHS